ncbi:glycosyltransferase [Kocuria rosea]|uniref:glycosyltransferase n=1 Tax=Kocuria rosea TaxID=1275 RepID=UPI002B251B01|nr:glycosyltransferase [Kocuria rosea]MEB2526483.1 glycosyltransferase [Kocuria rosea]MEB2619244.1 glycosyltransferase [Kocuria rosea]
MLKNRGLVEAVKRMRAGSSGDRRTAAGMYLAVLPGYRQSCMEILVDTFDGDLRLFVSDRHLDRTVKSGVRVSGLRTVRMVRLFGDRVFLQIGHLRETFALETLVVDLNPRSITAWMLLVVRRALKRRTLVWGHLHPRAGSETRTAAVRHAMRRLAAGTISYTYSDQDQARQELPGQPVWVATNALYRAKDIQPHATPEPAERTDVLYVGRFEPAKKVDLVVKAFAIAVQDSPDLRLRLVGGGSQRQQLTELAEQLSVADKVHFEGWVEGVAALRGFYSTAVCSVSPGFAGLGLTQSLGFGVPMVVAKDEPHSPEIELATTGGVIWVESDSPASMAEGLEIGFEQRGRLPVDDVAQFVREHYSAETMARGLRDALMEGK